MYMYPGITNQTYTHVGFSVLCNGHPIAFSRSHGSRVQSTHSLPEGHWTHPLVVFPGAQYIPNTSVDRMLYIREVI